VLTLAASSIDRLEWYANLSTLPKLTGNTVDKFVLLQSVTKKICVCSDKFFLESYIQDVQGKVCMGLVANTSRYQKSV
jgi:hypothetical protein